jgi:hypothetical protein
VQAAITAAIQSSEPTARIVFGGDLNVFPRPDDPIATAGGVPPSDQLGPLYGAGLRNLWENLVADVPSAAYSYTFQGQAQTLDNLFVNPALHGDLVQVRAAHVNAGWPADFAGDCARGVSDHDPQVARFRSRPLLRVADASTVEGDKGSTPLGFPVTLSRPLSADVTICAVAVDITAEFGQDHDGPLVTCQTLATGATGLTFSVGVRGDRRAEPDERLALLVLADPRVRLDDRWRWADRQRRLTRGGAGVVVGAPPVEPHRCGAPTDAGPPPMSNAAPDPGGPAAAGVPPATGREPPARGVTTRGLWRRAPFLSAPPPVARIAG